MRLTFHQAQTIIDGTEAKTREFELPVTPA